MWGVERMEDFMVKEHTIHLVEEKQKEDSIEVYHGTPQNLTRIKTSLDYTSKE
jgi:hypothetical protein